MLCYLLPTTLLPDGAAGAIWVWAAAAVCCRRHAPGRLSSHLPAHASVRPRLHSVPAGRRRQRTGGPRLSQALGGGHRLPPGHRHKGVLAAPAPDWSRQLGSACGRRRPCLPPSTLRVPSPSTAPRMEQIQNSVLLDDVRCGPSVNLRNCVVGPGCVLGDGCRLVSSCCSVSLCPSLFLRRPLGTAAGGLGQGPRGPAACTEGERTAAGLPWPLRYINRIIHPPPPPALLCPLQVDCQLAPGYSVPAGAELTEEVLPPAPLRE